MAKQIITNLEVEDLLGIQLKKFDEKKGVLEIRKVDFKQEHEEWLSKIGLRRAKKDEAEVIVFKTTGKNMLQKIRLKPGWKENRELISAI